MIRTGEELLLSIIIPVYKVEKYLEKCILSLQNQTLTNFEIIMIDDGSPDNCPEICDTLQKQYKNIVVIHKNNGGQAEARNYGIDVAKGKYLMFVDSDDYIEDNKFIENISSIIKQNNPDMIMYGYKKYYEETQKFSEKKSFIPNEDSIIDSLIKQNYFKACPWDKILKRELIIENNIRFPIGKLSEDIEWCSKILRIIDFNKISILNENPYIYVQRQQSTTKLVNEKHINDIINILSSELVKDEGGNSYIINSYLAYEYTMTLGIVSSKLYKNKYSQENKEKLFTYKKLLNYNLCKKVKLVYFLEKILGIRLTSNILGVFINIKEN